MGAIFRLVTWKPCLKKVKSGLFECFHKNKQIKKWTALIYQLSNKHVIKIKTEELFESVKTINFEYSGGNGGQPPP